MQNTNLINENKQNPYVWKEYIENISGSILTADIISNFITLFYKDVVENIEFKSLHFCIILKAEFKDQSIRSISNLIVIDNSYTLNKMIDLMLVFWELRTEEYHLKEVKTLFIYYRGFKPIKSIKSPKEETILKLINSPKINSNEYNYSGYQFPSTTDLSTWGNVLIQDNNNSIYIESFLKIRGQSIFYNIFKYDDHNLVQVFFNKILLLTFKDVIIKYPYSFKRIIKNNEFNYENGQIINKKIKRKVQYIKPLSKNLYRTTQFITLDIETKSVNGILTPICVSLFNGDTTFSFFRDDFNSELEMFSAAFNVLKARKYNYQKLYIHNLSYFDGVFLVKILSEIGRLKPIMRNGQIYNLRLELKGEKNQKYILNIRDSLLLLPVSLDKLSKAFKVNRPKSIFPLFCVNHLPLDYKGSIPNISDFKSKEDYEKYLILHKEKDKEWVLKEELIKYCENDVISLHQVIDHFSKVIFSLFRVDVLKYMTLSSLSFAIFRSQFLNEMNIPKINGQMYEDIFKSYKGGLVDMYIPEGSNLFLQDVNSEYPEAMTLDMPGGHVFYVEGNLDLNEKENFGFFKAKITANNDLDKPVLPVRINQHTLCTLGSWTDWYFSEELKEAQNRYGYKIIIEKGYIFERIQPFKEYVNSLYSLKSENTQNKPVYLIAKLLLNMLYGRFGMKPDKETSLILSHKEAEVYYSDNQISISDILDLGNGNEILRFIETNKNIENDNFNSNISIAIASAIVAYGRIKINSLKHLDNINVYYSDTDSLVTDKLLPSKYLGNKLGQLKLESKIKKGYFIAPKVYGYLDNQYNSIVKIKGLKNPFSIFELSKILFKDTVIKKYQDKWYRNWKEANISIRKELYTLLVTHNKRQLIYDSSGKLVKTRPYIFIDGIILNKNVDFIYNITEPSMKDKLIEAPKQK